MSTKEYDDRMMIGGKGFTIDHGKTVLIDCSPKSKEQAERWRKETDEKVRQYREARRR